MPTPPLSPAYPSSLIDTKNIDTKTTNTDSTQEVTKIVIGVDIAKLSFDVAFLYQNSTYYQHFDNNPQGFGLFLSFVMHSVTTANHHNAHNYNTQDKLPPLHLVMEATSIYWQALALWAYQLGLMVSVINPNFIRAYAKSLGIRTKTDKQDAKLLARYGRHENPKGWQPNRPTDTALIALNHERHYHKKELMRTKTRLETASCHNSPFIHQAISHLQAQLMMIDEQIWQIIHADPTLCHRATLLATIPGIGKKTVPFLLALIGDSRHFDSSKHLASYVGLAPRLHESGTSIHKKAHIGHSGRADIREILYLPAVVASFGRYPAYQSFVTRLQNKGKCKQQIIIAVMRKMLTIAWAVIRYDTPYDPTRHE